MTGLRLAPLGAVALLAAFAGLAAPCLAATTAARTNCSQAEKQAATRALATYQRSLAARKNAFFRAHHGATARKVFLKREQARLKALRVAAACTLIVTPPQARVLATVPAGANRMVFADGSLWVDGADGGDSPNGYVAQIDPGTNQVVATVPIGLGAAGDIGFGFGSIWVTNIDSATVLRIDPATHTVLASIPTGKTGSNGIAFSSQAVWIANHNEPPVQGGPSVTEIDPVTNQVENAIPVGGAQGGPPWVVGAAGSIWAFDPVGQQMVRIDPDAAKVTAAIPSSTGGHGANRHFATDGTNVWFTAGLLLQRINTATNTITTFVSQPTLAGYRLDTIYGLTYDAASIWLSGPCGSTACLLRVEPASGTITGDWTMPGSAADDALELTYAAGSMWVSEHNAVLRLDTGA